ncbi:metal-dependent hydrolase [Flavisphingomonas formosensis]|uniref:metal-dependent hydrolase n=1 Tax=Flavisphingomonas formosensis TaxID=861534 RepID=UPI0012F7DF0E|nr:metal-dependent hydrolase [Sphingomonas formosensis]
MQARNPRITFEAALPHWAPNHAFAQITNAGSTSLPAVETFLNTVMNRASAEIADEALKRDIAVFTAQEGNHYRQHRIFNKTLYPRYPGLKAHEAKLQADYEAMLANRSLRFNAAYCEGFESLGLIYAEFFFERIDDLTAGADARLVKLWQWHLGEEFEHRTVCYDVLRALGGGYAARLIGFFHAARHLGAYGKAVSTYLLSVDRRSMTDKARRASIAQEKRHRARFLRFALPRLLAILSPFYDPRRKAEPRGSARLLETIAAAVR